MNLKSLRSLSLCLVVLIGCASPQLTIQSNPPGAAVTVKDKTLGQTPLMIASEDFLKYQEGELIYFSIKKDGYADKEFFLQPTNIVNYTFELTKMSAENFNAIPIQYASLIHEITRELLIIQGLIFANKIDEAKNKLESFNKQYPNVAAAATLSASIEILKGNYDEAYTYLITAQKLDPKDLQVQKMLTAIGAKNREPSNAK